MPFNFCFHLAPNNMNYTKIYFISPVCKKHAMNHAFGRLEHWFLNLIWMLNSSLNNPSIEFSDNKTEYQGYIFQIWFLNDWLLFKTIEIIGQSCPEFHPGGNIYFPEYLSGVSTHPFERMSTCCVLKMAKLFSFAFRVKYPIFKSQPAWRTS